MVFTKKTTSIISHHFNVKFAFFKNKYPFTIFESWFVQSIQEIDLVTYMNIYVNTGV